MSTTNIKLKRSSVPGKQPNTSILELGEVALNTYDGKIFIKKDDGAESIVTIQEVTEDNLAIDSSLLDNSTASTLAGVLDDLDAAITTSAGGGLTQVTSDSTLTGLGTAGSPLSVVNDGHSHTVSTITNFTSSVNSAIDTRVDKTFVDALNVDADTLDGANGSFYLDYNNFVNTPSIPVSGVDFDPVGTDNSTDVTLAGSYDYLTITDQQITLNQIDYTTDISNTPTIGDGSITFSGDSIIGVSGSFSLNDTANSQITLSVNASAISITESQISDFDTYLPTADFTATANTWLATRSTSNLSEGTNLYYTTARANTDIDARVTKSFVDALNVDADTLDGANGSFYLDYNNFTNTPSIPTSGVDFDPVGTDNSTNVTLAGSYDYLTIAGQQITLGQIDYSTDISNLPTLYTTSDANTDIDARVTQAFVNALNVDADTLDGINSTSFLRSDANTSMSTGYLTLANDPTTSLHAATKQYVDTIAAAGIHYHLPVRAEVIGNMTATYNNGTSGVGATLTNAGTQTAFVADGVSLDVGDRVLVYEQTDATQNGVYVVTTVGDGSTNWVLTRADDADSYAPSDPDALGEGDAFFVKEGDTAAGELYVCNTTGTITFGTTNITFIQIAATAVFTAGSGIDLSGTTFSVAAGSGLTQDATGLSHSDTSTQASLTALTGADVVSDIDLDGFGHVTALSTRTMTLADFDSNLSSFVSTFTLPTVDGSNTQVMTTDGAGNLSFTTITGYSNTDVDSHLNTGTAANNQVLSWTGTDYDWVDQGSGSSYSNTDVDSHLNTGTAANNQVLSWNGSDYDWVDQSGGSGGSVTTSDTAPVSPSDGDLWFNTTDTTLSVYYDDVDSGQWVVTSGPQGISGVDGENVEVYTSNTAPSSPTPRTVWFNTNDASMYFYYNDGSSSQWVAISGPQGPQGPQGEQGPAGAGVTTGKAIAMAIVFG